jgi:hypothetical protein
MLVDLRPQESCCIKLLDFLCSTQCGNRNSGGDTIIFASKVIAVSALQPCPLNKRACTRTMNYLSPRQIAPPYGDFRLADDGAFPNLQENIVCGSVCHHTTVLTIDL